MYVKVDEEVDSKIEGWSYSNKDGDEEYVGINDMCNTVTLQLTGCYGVEFYKVDTPKLIKALQAAEAYFKENK